MPAKGSKRKAPASDEYQESPPAKKAARKPVASKQRGPLNEYAVDEGRRSSRNFFTAANSKKRRSYVSDSKNELRKKTDDLIAFIGDQQDQAPSTDVSDIVDSLLPDLAAVLPYSKSIIGTKSVDSSSESSLVQHALRVIETFQVATKQYDELNKRDTKIKRPETVDWKADAANLRKLNEEAMRTALDIVSSFIMPSPREVLAAPESNEIMKGIAWDMLEEARPCKMEDTWGTMAHNIVKGFAGVLKLVPGEK